MGEFLTAARQVLSDLGKPLSAREITQLAVERGLLETHGKTPWQTMKSKLSTDILHKRGRSQFMRSEKGRFALREWGEISEHVADRFQRALFDEDIVVIPAKAFHHYVPCVGLYSGPIDGKRLLQDCREMRRRDAEEDPSVIQLVSAFVVQWRGRYLTYKRAKRLPESRLHGYYSITFGGHLNPDDIPGLFNIFDPAEGYSFLWRELSEELRLSKNAVKRISYRGLLYDDSRPVSRQHVGIVYDVELSTGKYTIGERGFLIDSKFEGLDAVISRLGEFENWSEIVVKDDARRQGVRLPTAP